MPKNPATRPMPATMATSPKKPATTPMASAICAASGSSIAVPPISSSGGGQAQPEGDHACPPRALASGHDARVGSPDTDGGSAPASCGGSKCGLRLDSARPGGTGTTRVRFGRLQRRDRHLSALHRIAPAYSAGTDWGDDAAAAPRRAARRGGRGGPPARDPVPWDRRARGDAAARTERVDRVLALPRVRRCGGGDLARGGDRLRLGGAVRAASRQHPGQCDPAGGRSRRGRGRARAVPRHPHREGQGRRARADAAG